MNFDFWSGESTEELFSGAGYDLPEIDTSPGVKEILDKDSQSGSSAESAEDSLSWISSTDYCMSR